MSPLNHDVAEMISLLWRLAEVVCVLLAKVLLGKNGPGEEANRAGLKGDKLGQSQWLRCF